MSEAARGERHPYNGKPFYCKVCGLGFLGFMACEDVDCELEAEATAIARAEKEKRNKMSPISLCDLSKV